MTSYFNAVVCPLYPPWGRSEVRAKYFNMQQAATNRGLRTHLFINVPPEERSPGSLGDPTKAALLKTHIDEFNAILSDHISAFEASNPGLSLYHLHADTICQLVHTYVDLLDFRPLKTLQWCLSTPIHGSTRSSTTLSLSGLPTQPSTHGRLIISLEPNPIYFQILNLFLSCSFFFFYFRFTPILIITFTPHSLRFCTCTNPTGFFWFSWVQSPIFVNILAMRLMINLLFARCSSFWAPLTAL